MSNNKQSMKLYTEEQVEIAMAYVHAYHESDTRLKDEEILKKLTPIELPTDEEIEDYARQSGLVHPFITRGAKWMRDKIQGGKNEQQ
ncbi:hypothetical protein UFOVP428_37 [uncultured Caudovirales phage]|uniref:Uncharacterized protein n=1 Tax=uncultured Caudovirales phage TaxID=2100421 RepID=A0A6J5M770_9CAUD|nr:hypothetical protein UFOVP428_37 [uncultured Caudovirales phage]